MADDIGELVSTARSHSIRCVSPRIYRMSGPWSGQAKGPQLMPPRRSAHVFALGEKAVLRIALLAGLFIAAVLLAAVPAQAVGTNAVMTPSGWNASAVVRGDDTANLVVNLPFTMNWLGTNYTQLYLNMNGNVTFTGGFVSYTPGALTGVGQGIMAPFWADVDSRYVGSPNQLYYSDITSGSIPSVNGHKAFLVTWSAVQYYNNGNIASQTPTDTFQLVIVDRSDTGAGNFDFIYNYDQMLWDKGTASNTYARAGWATNGTTSYELPGSGTSGALLDSAATSTALVKSSLNSGGQLGRYTWQVRAGAPPNIPPQISLTDRLLEGNALDSYVGYDASADATATDADGSIASFTCTPSIPPTLPLGTSTFTWAATDNRAAVTTGTQTIVVTDTTPPSPPTLSSPTHATGIWSAVSTVTANSSASTDTCTGVTGASYSWSQNAPSVPNGTLDPSTISTVTLVNTTTVDSESFATAVWPAGWVVEPTGSAYMQLQAIHARGTDAMEVWSKNNTRRIADAYRDYDLSAFGSATLTFWDFASALSQVTDTATVDYSIDDGTTWTVLRTTSGPSVAQGWIQRSYSLPAGRTVRLRFSGSVNANSEYVDWDDVTVQGVATASLASLTTSVSAALSDGSWYFNMRVLDAAGNWTNNSSYGPVQIDQNPPVTTDNVPVNWANAPVTVTLSPTDAGSGVAYTRYRVNGGTVATYTAPFAVSAEQTNTLQYWSVDNVGHGETTRTVLVKVDAGAPTVPTALSASAVTTTSVEMSWSGSTDSTSGMSYYRVYQDGSVVVTSAATTCTVGGLTAGQTYAFSVSAVDVAGNASARSVNDTETMPISQVWLTIDPTVVAIGSVDPGIVSTLTSATAVTVGGVGIFNYDLSLSCNDFSNAATASVTPTMPSSLMSYRMYGSGTVPLTPFQTTSQIINSSAGVKYVWTRPYYFDFTLNVPWAFSPGTYTTKVMYTVVTR